MTDPNLSLQLQHFESWKRSLAADMDQLKLWLKRNDLLTPNAKSHLVRINEQLHSDRLVLAFVGEFSRGKTELINALFFGEYGQRILPSQPGRTTMCPTELFHEPDTPPYLRLLPIETRKLGKTLTELQQIPELWREYRLDVSSAEALSKTLMAVTETRRLPMKEAMELGFSQSDLKNEEDHLGQVSIPAWRHALISFPHPLLSQGLCILDTPGLNALGSEPDLTLDMLPKAHAILFVLSADTGVTASDLAIWQRHIQPIQDYPNLGLFAVLNKIDLLWDGLNSSNQIEQDLQRMTELTGRHLKLKPEQIYCLSAQKALLGQIKDDPELLSQSQLPPLTAALSTKAFLERRRSLHQRIVNDAWQLLDNGSRQLEGRRVQLLTQKQKLEQLKRQDKYRMLELLANSEQEEKTYQKQQIALSPSQRLVQRHIEMLLPLIGVEQLEAELHHIRQDLVNSWTTLGLNLAIRSFFDLFEGRLSQLSHELDLGNKMVSSVYNRFNETTSQQSLRHLRPLKPKLIDARQFQRQFNQIRNETVYYRDQLKLTFTEHSSVVHNFFAVTVKRIGKLFAQIHKEITLWSAEVLEPLAQHIESHRSQASQYRQQLEQMKNDEGLLDVRLKALDQAVQDLDDDLAMAGHMQDLLSLTPSEHQDPLILMSDPG